MRSGLTTLGRAMRAGRTAVLTILGFGFICVAVWLAAGVPFGLAAVGLSLLLIEALSERGDGR